MENQPNLAKIELFSQNPENHKNPVLPSLDALRAVKQHFFRDKYVSKQVKISILSQIELFSQSTENQPKWKISQNGKSAKLEPKSNFSAKIRKIIKILCYQV